MCCGTHVCCAFAVASEWKALQAVSLVARRASRERAQRSRANRASARLGPTKSGFKNLIQVTWKTSQSDPFTVSPWVEFFYAEAWQLGGVFLQWPILRLGGLKRSCNFRSEQLQARCATAR